MKVLLVSPIDPDIPGKLKFLVGGENTYTRTLLTNPPLGVTYTHHQEALKMGKIKYTSWQKLLSLLMKIRILPPDGGVQSLDIKDHFDLIHCHGYCLHLKNYHGPVVLSDSSSNLLFLRGYLGWGTFRIKIAYLIRGFIAKILDVYDPNLNIKETSLIVWSKFAKRLHLEFGIAQNKVIIIPPGIAINSFPKRHAHLGLNLLFVGIWFNRKGGDLVIKAYNKLKSKYPNLRLTLIGELPKNIKLSKSIYHRNYLSREKLMSLIFPKADLLVLVPPKAEGYGMVVLEAAGMGIPAIITRVGALPELVENDKNGFVIKPGSLDKLIWAIETFITKPELQKKMGKAARKRFLEQFSIKVTNKKLLQAYNEALIKFS